MKAVLTIMLCLVAGYVFADVTAEIVSYDLDSRNGSIRVWTQYKVDGVEVDSNYPKINGKEVFCVRYQITNFAGMTANQIKTRVAQDLISHANTLIRQTFLKKANATLNLSNAIGSKITRQSTKIQLDTDGDGVNDKEWTLKTDGSYTEAVISP